MRSIVAEQPHVLVVDDDSRIAAALRRALIYEGYHVEVAPDGQIALNRARERMPDLAILDVMMPGIDGLEVTRRLRAEGDVPILITTVVATPIKHSSASQTILITCNACARSYGIAYLGPTLRDIFPKTIPRQHDGQVSHPHSRLRFALPCRRY